MIDLHTHSTASDGTDSPGRAGRRRRARRACDVLAITDHDTTAGWDEARRRASGRADDRARHRVLLRATSAEDGRRISLHLLGYLFDPDDPSCAPSGRELRESRLQRGRQMVENMAADGIPITWAQVQALAAAGRSAVRTSAARWSRPASYPTWTTAFRDLLSLAAAATTCARLDTDVFEAIAAGPRGRWAAGVRPSARPPARAGRERRDDRRDGRGRAGRARGRSSRSGRRPIARRPPAWRANSAWSAPARPTTTARTSSPRSRPARPSRTPTRRCSPRRPRAVPSRTSRRARQNSIRRRAVSGGFSTAGECAAPVMTVAPAPSRAPCRCCIAGGQASSSAPWRTSVGRPTAASSATRSGSVAQRLAHALQHRRHAGEEAPLEEGGQRRRRLDVAGLRAVDRLGWRRRPPRVRRPRAPARAARSCAARSPPSAAGPEHISTSDANAVRRRRSRRPGRPARRRSGRAGAPAAASAGGDRAHHGAERVGRVVGRIGRSGRLELARQVDRGDREAGFGERCEQRREVLLAAGVPGQQQHRRCAGSPVCSAAIGPQAVSSRAGSPPTRELGRHWIDRRRRAGDEEAGAERVDQAAGRRRGDGEAWCGVPGRSGRVGRCRTASARPAAPLPAFRGTCRRSRSRSARSVVSACQAKRASGRSAARRCGRRPDQVARRCRGERRTARRAGRPPMSASWRVDLPVLASSSCSVPPAGSRAAISMPGRGRARDRCRAGST